METDRQQQAMETTKNLPEFQTPQKICPRTPRGDFLRQQKLACWEHEKKMGWKGGKEVFFGGWWRVGGVSVADIKPAQKDILTIFCHKNDRSELSIAILVKLHLSTGYLERDRP